MSLQVRALARRVDSKALQEAVGCMYSVSKLVGAENFANPAKVRLDGITKTCFRPISICASDTH